MPVASEAAGADTGAVSVIDVQVVGGVGVDTTVRVPQLPVPAVDTVHVPPITRSVGHTGSGWALGLHALSVRTHLVDLIGDDPEGEVVRRRFADAGLSFGWAIDPAGTKRSVNLVDPAGHRTSLYDGRGQGAVETDPSFWREPMDRARHVHVSINDWTRPALRRAVALGRTVSTDLHDWDGEHPHHLEFALAADVVLLSAIATAGASARLAERILREGRAVVVVTTAGVEGSTVHVLHAGALRAEHVAARPLPGGVELDANGAGDAYGAGFLAAWLAGRDPIECARWGSIAGAHAVATPGTHVSPITRSLLEQRLATG
jgi:sugar/nucleoside kinase (ribokinase family)